jgi:hypothetical protein
MKLSGLPINEIAARQGIDRVTVWRRCKAVETEAVLQLSEEPVFNQIAREVARLTDLEEKSRQAAEKTKSDRAKIGYLGEARRAATARQALLIGVGLYPKAPEQVFRINATLRPKDIRDSEKPKKLRSRPELIQDLLNKMQNTSSPFNESGEQATAGDPSTGPSAND